MARVDQDFTEGGRRCVLVRTTTSEEKTWSWGKAQLQLCLGQSWRDTVLFLLLHAARPWNKVRLGSDCDGSVDLISQEDDISWCRPCALRTKEVDTADLAKGGGLIRVDLSEPDESGPF